MIERIEHQGKLLHECPLPGEGRDHNTTPAHPNGVQLSRDRFLLTYSTRSFRGRDDERSAVYQLRADSWTGPILADGWFSRTRDDWDPLGDGTKNVLQHGHPTVIGVPKGALINGKRVAHENVFAAMWRICARQFDPETGLIFWDAETPELIRATRDSQWVHFRLNDAEDDIDFLNEPRPLRQKGYEDGPQRCENPDVKSFIKGFVPGVSANDDCSLWVDMNTLSGADNTTGKGHVMPFGYAFNPQLGRYEWTKCGPLVGPALFEASIARYNGGFVGSSRQLTGATGMKPEDGKTASVNWWRCDDPFDPTPPKLVAPAEQQNWHPTAAFAGPDGTVRRLGGCCDPSIKRGGRNPVYIVGVDPENDFAIIDQHEIFDGVKAGIPVKPAPYCDFNKLLPHTGGREQVVLHRVWTPNTPDPARVAKGLPPLTPEEVDACGIYWAKLIYDEPQPAMWQFEK